MAEYIEREDVLELAKRGFIVGNRNYSSVVAFINDIPSADVVDRDEGIRMGAELAAMHGSDATSRELEKAYLDGVEEGLRKARKSGRWIEIRFDTDEEENHLGSLKCSECGLFIAPFVKVNYCPNCGSDMREES